MKVRFNASKSKYMIFSKHIYENNEPIMFNNERVKTVSEHNNLGVWLTHKSEWGKHVQDICLKANRKLSVLRRVNFLQRSTLNTLYKQTVRSVNDYCLPVYCNSLKQTEIGQLNILQYKAAKVVHDTLHLSSADKLNKDLGWETLTDRAKCLGLSVFHKIHRYETRPLVRQYMPVYNDRGSGKYQQFKYKNKNYDMSFYPFYTKEWNKLPHTTRKKNTDDFKKDIKIIYKPTRYKHFERGTKYGCSLLTRIRIGRSYLNEQSFQIGHTDASKCLCEHPQETSLHYITQCWLYTEERRTLYDQVEQIFPKFKSLGQNKQYEFLVEGYMKDNPDYLQLNVKIMILTQNYILKTKQFKQ